METFKLILHTNGDDKCLRNVVNYPIGKDQVLKDWQEHLPVCR